MFDLYIKAALRLSDIGEKPFSRATLFNFQGRFQAYEQEKGINLIEGVFNSLTSKQLEKLEVKTHIQCSDSTLISSNIKRYSCIQLLIEVLLRLYRVLDKQDQQAFSESMKPYWQLKADHYVYALKSVDLPHELEALGQLYKQVYNRLQAKYKEREPWQTFERMFREHFIVIDEQPTAKASEELGSNAVQTPDDKDAAYRNKRCEQVRGYSFNITETAVPGYALQLINAVATTSAIKMMQPYSTSDWGLSKTKPRTCIKCTPTEAMEVNKPTRPCNRKESFI